MKIRRKVCNEAGNKVKTIIMIKLLLPYKIQDKRKSERVESYTWNK